ncbi:MAG: sulfatase [Clostridiaceae bacterium]
MKELKRPNVLIIYTDQQRLDSIKCYGNNIAYTPNIDSLAKQGAKFDKYYVQNPVCMPSRMSFLTGQYPASLGIGDNGISLPEDTLTINKIINPYGYHTGQIGKLHFKPHVSRDHRDPLPPYGFDTFILSDEPGCYNDAYTKWVESINGNMVDKIRTSLPPAAFNYGHESYSNVGRETNEPYIFEGEEEYTHSSFVASETCRFLRNHKDEPFFAISGFYAPHPPINPPKKFVDLYDISKIDLPKMGNDEELCNELKDLSDDEIKKIIQYYLALASHVDDCVGDILTALKELELEENTIVIFTTDHGEYLGDHGRIQKGMPGHDVIVNVPFIIRYPRHIKAETEIKELVEAVDVVPTILDYLGIQKPRIVQGKSFKPVLDGKIKEHREDVFIERFNNKGFRETTVATKEYKYYISSQGEEILYDLINDKYELINLVDNIEYENIKSLMRKRMLLRMQNSSYKKLDKDGEY